jgi:hypothetical protein
MWLETPEDGRAAFQMRLATACSATVEDLGAFAVVGGGLSLVKLDIENTVAGTVSHVTSP